MAHYTTSSTKLFQAALQSRFYTLEVAQDFSDAMSKVVYGVVDSQRDGFAALTKFLGQGVRGKNIFNRHTRFPDTDDDIFITTYDQQIQRTLIALESVLSFRLTNVAKDTDKGTEASGSNRNGGQATQNYKDVANDQATQDNAKRFEELKRQFCSYLNDHLRIKNQHEVEKDLSLHWHAAPATTST